MKKSQVLVIFSIFLCVLMLCGCGSKTLESANVEPVADLTNGGVKIEYNKDLKEIYVGGEGEVLNYFEPDIALGVDKPGWRVGLKFTAAAEVTEYETGIMTMQGKTISAGQFYRNVNGQKSRDMIVYPVFSEEEREIEIKVIWQDGTKEQTYKVKVLPHTQFRK